MFDDLEFRRFLFRCALPIFVAIVSKQGSDLANAVFGKGSTVAAAIILLGMFLSFFLIFNVYWSLHKAPTLSSNKFKGEEKNAKQHPSRLKIVAGEQSK